MCVLLHMREVYEKHHPAEGINLQVVCGEFSYKRE